MNRTMKQGLVIGLPRSADSDENEKMVFYRFSTNSDDDTWVSENRTFDESVSEGIADFQNGFVPHDETLEIIEAEVIRRTVIRASVATETVTT